MRRAFNGGCFANDEFDLLRPFPAARAAQADPNRPLLLHGELAEGYKPFLFHVPTGTRTKKWLLASTVWLREKKMATQRKNTQAAETASAAAEDIKNQAAGGAERAREAAEAQAGSWSFRLGERGATIAEAVRSAGKASRGKEDWFADAAEALGNQIAELSEAAKAKSGPELRAQAERMVRERPALIMGAAVVAGLALGRFLRSVAPHSQAEEASDEPRK